MRHQSCFGGAYFIAAVCVLFIAVNSGCSARSENSIPPAKQSSSETTPKSDTDATEPVANDSENTSPTIVRSGGDSSPRTENELGSNPEQSDSNSENPAGSEQTGPKTASATSASGGTPKKPKARSNPVEAFEKARSLKALAATEEKNGKFGKAFELSSRAWEVVRQFPDDARCKSLEKELAADLDLQGKAANEKSGINGKFSSKTLIEK